MWGSQSQEQKLVRVTAPQLGMETGFGTVQVREQMRVEEMEETMVCYWMVERSDKQLGKKSFLGALVMGMVE